MKAILFTRYGSPDVLQLREIERPTPQADQVLVKISAASVNPLDWHRMRADPILARTTEGWLRPKNPGIGADIAGRVEAVGQNVTEFRAGDEVFGEISAGGFAEYAAVDHKLLTLKPEGVSFEQAAAAPVAALTALQGLRDHGNIQAGQSVLVNGASGGVGSFGVQIAKAFGAHVTAVSSTRNQDLVCSLGADRALDYTRTNFTKTGDSYDLIFDAVGNHKVADYKRALKPGGVTVVAGFESMRRLFQHMLLGGKAIKIFTAQMKQADLAFIGELLDTDAIQSLIDRRYPLEQTAEAIRYVESKRARGKVIITVAAQ